MITEIPECKKNEVTIFNIIKYYPQWAYFPGAQWEHSDGFGLVYPGDKGHQMLQAFSFEVLGIGAMKEWMGDADIGGYFFHVFKSHPVPIATGLLEGKVTKLIGESDRDSSNNRINIGFGHHSSRYQPYAHREALKYAYTECNGTACEIAMKKHLPLVEVLHDYLVRSLKPDEYGYGEKPLFESADLLVKSLEPSFKREEAKLAKNIFLE